MSKGSSKVGSFRAVLVCALLITAASIISAEQYEADFQSYYVAHHWFALRDVVQNRKTSVFYRGAVEAAFNQPKRAQTDLEAVTRASPHSNEAYEAHTLLAGLYLRLGQYREALAQTDAMLAEKPDAEDVKNVRSLFRVLGETPDQAIVQKKRSTVQMHIDDGNLFLPITINGAFADYIFDTGAAISLLSDSEAKRLNLVVRDIDTKMEGMSGVGTGARVAVADRVVLGNIRLAHVAFYVLPDQQPPFNGLRPGRQGILGISVIVALQTMRWHPRDGSFEFGFPSKGDGIRQSNIAFDGAVPLTQVVFQQKTMEFSLDTGAQNTDMYPSFAKEFADFVSASGEKESRKLTGVDGSASFDSVLVPSVTLQVDAHDLSLKPAHVLLVEHSSNSQWYFGNLGMDLLSREHSVTLDFQSMTLTLE